MNADFERNPQSAQPSALSLLERREIEARIALPLIQAYAEKMGREQAVAVATKVIQRLAGAAGRQMVEKLGGNDITALAKVVRHVWAQNGALEITMLEENNLKLSFNVTRCRYAELYEKLGLEEFGGCLSCSRDAAFAEGFNPRLELQRTQTIMEGASHCDFRFTLG